ncbi:MAG: NTP transferase domain-containing protein [Christensenellaceae bacterium]|jgi:hypothetical protein|nr:NTP transferase domain-containing protein [Christensenellaceae bacterium]
MQPVLVIMAAGMGSRYGGLKQIDPVDAAGNLIIDFSIYDALRAGFREVICVIKHEIEADFKQAIGCRIEKHAAIQYAYQQLDALPAGFAVPPARQKPWGTTHAILCAGAQIAGRPFAVINADDYYGPEAFRRLYDYLAADTPDAEHALVAWQLENTLTEHGSVARGVCAVREGYLAHIQERRKVFLRGGIGEYTEDDGATFIPLPPGTPVSMNFWGFKPGILPLLAATFERNFAAGVAADPLRYEDLLPNAVQAAIDAGAARVRVLSTPDKWFGVTYQEDRPMVQRAVAALKAQGVYEEGLW